MNISRVFTSWEFVVVLLILVIGLGFLITFALRPGEFQKSRTYVFTSILAGVTIVLVGFSLAVSAISLHDAQSLIRVYTTKLSVDKLWLYPNELFAKSRLARPEFLKGFYYNNPDLQRACADRQLQEPQSCQSVLEEQAISIILIQCWEDFLTVHALDATGELIWMNNFIQWAQNSYLKQYYETLKYNYKETTRELAVLLFEYADKLPKIDPKPDMYHQTVEFLVQDPRYKNLFKEITISEKKFVIQ